jgi:isopentenyl diphosphate isomerase/L-lactate dehydrogenase-like FMN-dependent dehydrogenase
MFDSGVRGASDVFKALALGAQFVFVGRLWVWGLSIMGEHGVRHVMKSLLADFDILLNVDWYQNVVKIVVNRDALESLPKAYTLIQERAKL